MEIHLKRGRAIPVGYNTGAGIPVPLTSVQTLELIIAGTSLGEYVVNKQQGAAGVSWGRFQLLHMDCNFKNRHTSFLGEPMIELLLDGDEGDNDNDNLEPRISIPCNEFMVLVLGGGNTPSCTMDTMIHPISMSHCQIYTIPTCQGGPESPTTINCCIFLSYCIATMHLLDNTIGNNIHPKPRTQEGLLEIVNIECPNILKIMLALPSIDMSDQDNVLPFLQNIYWTDLGIPVQAEFASKFYEVSTIAMVQHPELLSCEENKIRDELFGDIRSLMNDTLDSLGVSATFYAGEHQFAILRCEKTSPILNATIYAVPYWYHVIDTLGIPVAENDSEDTVPDTCLWIRFKGCTPLCVVMLLLSAPLRYNVVYKYFICKAEPTSLYIPWTTRNWVHHLSLLILSMLLPENQEIYQQGCLILR
jgi:hypothetical protein